MIERIRLQVQASEMRFLQKINGVSLFTRCTFHEIRKSLEPLPLQIKRSQLRRFGHVSRMYEKKLSNKLYLPKQIGKKQLYDPELHCRWINITLRILGGISWDFTQAKWWGDRKPWSVVAFSQAAAPATLTVNRTIRREKIFLEVFNGFVCFSTVCSVKVAFVQIFHFIYQLLYFLNYF